MSFQPTAAEERWLTLTHRLRGSVEAAHLAAYTGGWRTARLPSRCTFFVLGLVAAGMVAVIADYFGSTDSLVVPALVSLGLAEWLIIRRRYFESGIEEALEVAGLLMLGEALANHVGTSMSVGAGFAAAALAIAGFRVLNPLFTTLAVLAFLFALHASATAEGMTCYGIGAAALAGGAYSFRRPSHDHMLDYLVIVMPVAGYLWAAAPYQLSGTPDYVHGAASRWLIPIFSLGFAVGALAIGLLRRTHVPFIAFMLGVGCAAYELRNLTGLPLAARLIIGGCVLLLVSVAIERYLRVPRRGITSCPLEEDSESDSVLSVAGAAVLAPHVPSKGTAFHVGGGGFGGGGASGDF